MESQASPEKLPGARFSQSEVIGPL